MADGPHVITLIRYYMCKLLMVQLLGCQVDQTPVKNGLTLVGGARLERLSIRKPRFNVLKAGHIGYCPLKKFFIEFHNGSWCHLHSMV
jgi:hypothetical protein